MSSRREHPTLDAEQAWRHRPPAEIAAETGVPENSVRGTLNRLRKDNRVFKVGDVWRPAGPIRQPDGSTVEVTPDGHIVSVPAHLAGNNTPDANAPGVKKDWG